MKRTIHLVNVGNPTRWISVPFGLAFLARALIAHGVAVEIIDLLPVEPDRRREFFARRLDEIGPGGIFGFGLIMGNHNVAVTLEFAAMVKEANAANILVLGGPAATAAPRLLFENSPADYVVLGEGEERLRMLAEALFAGETEPAIEGVLSRLRPDPEAFHPTSAPKVAKIRDLDRYAPPAYELLDMDFYTRYLKASGRCFDIVASRGCWGACSFCFRFVGVGYHGRSADSILDEIALAEEKWGVRDFAFTDENFFQNRETFFALMRRAGERGLSFRFRCMTRVDDVDAEVAAALSAHNCLGVSFGVESASDETLRRIYKRTRVDDIAAKVALLQREGIEARGSFILGFPHDTEADFAAIRDFIERNALVGHCTINFLTPLPATRLYAEHREKCAPRGEWEYFQRVDAASLYRELVVNLTELPDEVLLRWRDRLKDLGQSEIVVPEGFAGFVKDRE